MPRPVELQPSDLKHLCDPSEFDFKSTAEVAPLEDVIGQERAVRALEFGLNMKSFGYNIFVTGLEGTGKTTIVRDIANRHARGLSTPDDWCMVNNFSDEHRPRAIRLPPGHAARFAKAMNRFIEGLKGRLQREFESEGYRNRLAGIRQVYSEKKQKLEAALGASAKKKGLLLEQTPTGFRATPMAGDKPMTPEAYQMLSKEDRAVVEAHINDIQTDIESMVRETRKLRLVMQQALTGLGGEVARFLVDSRLAAIRETYNDCRDVVAYLDAVRSDIIENAEDFFPAKEKPESPELAMFAQAVPTLRRYAVNVLVDRLNDGGAPVIFEPNPTFRNVFGQIEKRVHMGAVTTDFTMVRAGSLLRANGGYLIMEVDAVIMNPLVWDALKRALNNRSLFIEEPAVGMGTAPAALRPAPIDLDVKVILIGSVRPFQALQSVDAKFNKLFKVRADFDYEVARSGEAVRQYARFIARVCREEHLLDFTPEGVAQVVAFGERQLARKNKLSIRFGPIVGIIKEADYWARQDGADLVSGGHVERAVEEIRFRYNLYEEKVHESYVNETIMIDVSNDVVGQVNALAVYQTGDVAFGRPSRITAETYMGANGVINVEREAKLSGKTHDKGVLILSGFLGKTFAQKYPLSLTISIAFEQSYGGIDGDSASSTELYAILSSLSGLPIHQGIAVTGSVNQKGEIQAIGGVIQKTEGFFDVCRARGLTGRQGVIIPRVNVRNLMVKKEVVEAVADGRFHVYPVSTVAEGIEILTGKPAGKPDRRGNYPADTVYGRVQRQLKTYLHQSLQLKQMARKKKPAAKKKPG